ncbi:MAG: mannose-1-phosphate guanylyltransferase/mannose-6-phosphate isomerase [Pseudomonas marincola]
MTIKFPGKIRPVILCGGQGTRLWPISRASFPKQFARIFSEKSLFQETLELVSDKTLFSAPVVIGAESFEHILRSHLNEVKVERCQLILESEGRNTAAAIALACLSSKKDEYLLVLPSDHHIKDKQQFEEDVRGLLDDVQSGFIGLFGITPEYPSSDYGYIESYKNPHDVSSSNKLIKSFREKPNQQVAEEYFKSGHHYWNAGMFLFDRKHMLQELALHANPILETCKKALLAGTQNEMKFRTDPKIYATVPSQPIDIAVMEVTENAIVRAAKFDWLDVGSWQSYATTCNHDDEGNDTNGRVYLEDCKKNLIHAEGKLVTAIGLEGHAIIDTDDALLIMPLEKIGQLSNFVKKMRKDGIYEAKHHQKVRRPWGSYKSIHHGEEHQVKHIIVKPNEKLSYQFHHFRSEHWIVVKGKGVVTIGEEEKTVQKNDSVYIPVRTPHRLFNPYTTELHLIEVQYGSYLGEDDIVRLDDEYGRVESANHKINQGEKV